MNAEAVVQRANQQRKVLELLEQGQSTIARLSGYTGIDKATVYRRLKALEARRQVRVVGHVRRAAIWGAVVS